MRTLAAVLLLGLLLPAAVFAKERRTVDKRAMEALKNADRLVYRPLEEGLRDLALEFEVDTIKGRLKCLWLYRAPTDELPARQKFAVTNVEDRRTRRQYAAGLREYFDIVSYPVLLRPFAEEAEGMHVLWEETARGPGTVLEAIDQEKAEYAEIRYLWGEDGLPKEMSRTRWDFDEDEGRYKVEYTATCEWTQEGRHRVLAGVNSDWTGFRILARYRYREVKGILLPSVVTRINPMEGEDDLVLGNLRVNEGISDEEFARW